jgi:hypothetical protein
MLEVSNIRSVDVLLCRGRKIHASCNNPNPNPTLSRLMQRSRMLSDVLSGDTGSVAES